MYSCSKCGLGVLVVGLPEPIRACDCKVKKGWFRKAPAPILASVEANLYGRGGVSVGGLR